MTAARPMCDEGRPMRSGCTRLARWWITTAGGELPLCDLHAEGYLRHPESVYPRRPIQVERWRADMASTDPARVKRGMDAAFQRRRS